jgi:DNA polymerase-3 subunit epsilon
MVVPAEGEPDFLALPDAMAVVVFESAEGRTILIATTASARDLARRRLSPDPAARTTHADIRSLCAGGCVRAIRVGSSLEADAVYLRQARERLPHLAKVVSERWRAWFAHVDPDAQFPQWTKTNLMGLVGVRSASTAIEGQNRGVLLGPIPDKDAAGRFIEAVIDAFDLCRYHNLLVQAPKALACAYKEMGRCAAPCDGTETMEGYRERTRAAIELLASGGIDAEIEREKAEMGAASAAQEFDHALKCRKQAERLETLAKPTFSQVARLDRWNLLMVLPSPEKGRVRLALAKRGRLLLLGDVDPADDRAIESVCGVVQSAVQRPEPLTFNQESIDSIGLLTRWLFRPEKKRRGVVLDLRSGAPQVAAVKKAAASLLKKPAEEPPESHEIEAE